MSEHQSMQDWPTKTYSFPLPLRYHLSKKVGKGVVICLHGFQDHALSMLKRIGWWEATLPFQTLALNGPFPVPVWAGNGFKEAYSWYFRDSSRNLVLAPPNITAERVRDFLRDIGLEKTPKVLFGFSQGGFFAPYLAAQIQNLKGIVGFGCDYPEDAYAACPPLTVHAIHGVDDERISIASARQTFNEVVKSRHHGDFHEVANLGHRVDPVIAPLVQNLVEKMFSEIFGETDGDL